MVAKKSATHTTFVATVQQLKALQLPLELDGSEVGIYTNNRKAQLVREVIASILMGQERSLLVLNL